MKTLICVVFVLLLSACQRNPAAQPAKEYQMQGEVVGLDPAAHLATVKAGKIEGWMEAMTMEYPIPNAQEYKVLRVGDKVTATVHVTREKYWLTNVRKERN